MKADAPPLMQLNDLRKSYRLRRGIMERLRGVQRVVTAVDGGYRMIYSARRLGETYRIYSANSVDGLLWQRDSLPLLDVAASGWDSEMVCYGSRLDTTQGNYLLYNGNAYGKDGFGAALLT